MKLWAVAELPPPTFLDAHRELPPIVARLLWNRGLRSGEEINRFLNPDYSRDSYDPFLFRDMARAVEIIFDYLKTGAKITVHGDYDADGVDAAAILVKTLRLLGGQVDVFIPHRELDGYGMNLKTIDYLKAQGTGLIITCDCGISNTAEVKRAHELGLQVIITDHHAMPLELPPADAILHPLVPGETYPDKTLSGGGVAFKLAQGILKYNELHGFSAKGGPASGWEKWLLDMVAISTVADMVPLLGESRTLVHYGLTVLNKTHNFGLKALLKKAGLINEQGTPKRGAFTTHTIGFQIAPRLNAAGRMDHANVAFALLLADTVAEAEALAEQLNQNNIDRQKLTEKIVTEARYQIVKEAQENNPCLFAFGENWPTGILGLIASKIKEEFQRPTLVMGKNKGAIVGSGRSIAGFNLIETLKTMSEWFLKFGGHPMAAGFSLRPEVELEAFKTALLARAALGLKNLDLTARLTIEAEVDLDEINWKLWEYLQKFEPFGVANDEPVYAATGLTVRSIDPVGSDGQHLRIAVQHNSHLVRKTIAFGFGDLERHPLDWKNYLKPGVKIDLAFTIGVNEWNGHRELQLQVVDIKKSG